MSLAQSQSAMVESMGKAGVAMGAMNKAVDPLAMAKIMSELQFPFIPQYVGNLAIKVNT